MTEIIRKLKERLDIEFPGWKFFALNLRYISISKNNCSLTSVCLNYNYNEPEEIINYHLYELKTRYNLHRLIIDLLKSARKFSNHNNCIKCGQYVETQYKTATDDETGQKYEGLSKSCKCGFNWYEECKEKPVAHEPRVTNQLELPF